MRKKREKEGHADLELDEIKNTTIKEKSVTEEDN